MSKKARDFRFFDQWCRRHGMRPVQRVKDATVDGRPVGDILLADSGDMISQAQYPPTQGNEHEMAHFYRTGFAIDRPGDRTWLACFNDYPPDAFSDYETPARLAKRIEDALTFAAQMLRDTHQAGLYRGNDRRILC